MKKRIVLSVIAVIGTSAQAALIQYGFQGADPYAAALTGGSGITVSAISYVQGTVSGGGDSTVAYQSGSPANRFFALSSKDLGNLPGSTDYDANQSRFHFGFTVDAGMSVDLSGASLKADLSAIRNPGTATAYPIRAFWTYRINAGAWVADGPSLRVDAATGGATVNGTLYDAATDAQLAGYAITAADIVTATRTWGLSDNSIPVLDAGDTIEFACHVVDNTVDQWWAYGAVDNIKLDGISIAAIPEPATMGLIGLGTAGLLLVRRFRI